MADNRKEIDLIIRAAVQNGKSVTDIAKSVVTLEENLDQLVKAAERGENALDELRATQQALKTVQDQLSRHSTLIKTYNDLATKIGELEAKVKSSSQKFAEHQEKIHQSGVATEQQLATTVKLGTALRTNEDNLARATKSYQSVATALRDLGFNTDDLASGQEKINAAVLNTAAATARAEQQLIDYTATVKRARAEQDEAYAINADIDAQRRLTEALQKTAREAIATANGYVTLARAAKTLKASTTNVTGAVGAILSSEKVKLSTQSGIEAEIKRLAATLAAAKGPIDDYQAKLKELQAAQKALNSQANLVDLYSKQVAALRQARTEFVENRAKMLEYAAALRDGGVANDELARKLKQAQTDTAAAARNLKEEVIATRRLRQEMRDAGLATNDLSATQDRLTTAARTSAQAMQQLSNNYREYGNAAKDAAITSRSFTDGGRTTLSLLQRLRGEILSVIAAYVGLYGAVNEAGDVIAAFNERQATQNRLSVAVGNNVQAIGAEYQYVREQAERLGLEFSTVSAAYSKFAVAALKSGASLQETRFIFESFSEVGTVIGLTGDKMALIFRALEQSMSKGKIQAEELVQQLSDSLPGSFQVLQQALKDKFPDLSAALKAGEVSSAELLTFAQKYKDIIADQLPAATESLIAKQNRYNNALYDFRLAVADSGFIQAFTNLIQRATNFFASAEGREFAADLGAAFSAVVKVLDSVIRNIDEIAQALAIVAIAYGSKTFIGLGVSAINAAREVRTLNTALGNTVTALGVAKGAMVLLNVAAAAFTFGTLLRQFEIFRVAAIEFVVFIEQSLTKLKYVWKLFWTDLTDFAKDGFASMLNSLSLFNRTAGKAMAAALRLAGKNELADNIDNAMEAMKVGAKHTSEAYNEVLVQMEADLDRIRAIGDDMIKAEKDARTARATESTATATTNPGASTLPQVIDGEEEKERRIKAKEQIEAELAAIEARIDRNEKTSLAKRLEAIDEGYFKLIRKIKDLGGAEAEEFSQQLNEKLSQLRIQEIKKFNAGLVEQQNSLKDALAQIDVQIAKGETATLEQRLKAVRDKYQDTYRDLEVFREQLLENNLDTIFADLAKVRLDSGVLSLQNLERQSFYEDQINSILNERKAKLETIRVMEDNGLITSLQAKERSAEVVNELQPSIERLAEEALAFVENMILATEAVGGTTTALEELRAKLIQARESGKGISDELISAAEVNERLATGAVNAFDTLAQSIARGETQIHSFGDAIKAVGRAFLQFAADFLREIALMIIKQQILNALQNSSFGGSIAGAANALVAHEGGIVGRTTNRTRSISPRDWVAAPRLHNGNGAALAPDEYRAILKRNEEVLTSDDPRNILNGGGLANGNAAPAGDTSIYNMIDSGSFVSAGLSTPVGSKAVKNYITANRSEIKVILGIG